jgi:D-glycero-D-manno-heptose 1,7-bisphosphate phosphatase
MPLKQKLKRFAVLDRDGTIIEERKYLADAAQVKLLPGAAAGMHALSELGVGLVVVTNQSGIARGYFGEDDLKAVNQRMIELLESHSVLIAGVYVCRHLPEDGCECRKPRAGLLMRAASDWGFDVSECFVAGDKACDIELGRNVGATTFLVRTGYGAQLAESGYAEADFIVNDLAEIAETVDRCLADARVRKAARHDNVVEPND